MMADRTRFLRASGCTFAARRSRGGSLSLRSRPVPAADRPLDVQLWSYNFDPEPTGVGIVSTVWARELQALGHRVRVVAAHPHYPEPRWGHSVRPYREVRSGIEVLRLPLYIGRATTRQRLMQEVSFLAAQSAAAPFLRRPDVLVSVSPSFPALLPGIGYARTRRVPWVLWLHDLLPDGAMATGILNDGNVAIRAARRLELAAYREADRIVVLSTRFTENLLAKGVPQGKIELIYDPATRVPTRLAEPGSGPGLRLLSMGNIGFSQGLAPLVRAFEDPIAGAPPRATLTITGTGVAAEDVRVEVRSERVAMPGLVSDERLERELTGADIGLVTQQYDGGEFNIPSKLMNFMAYGLPVLAVVNPSGEVARLVREAGGGWVVDSSDPGAFPREVARLLEAPDEVRQRARAARAYAEQHFERPAFARRFERTLQEVVAVGHGGPAAGHGGAAAGQPRP